MSQRMLLVVAAGFGALVVAGTWALLRSQRAEPAPREALAPATEVRLEEELRRRDLELARLRAEVQQLESLLSQQRELAAARSAAAEPAAAPADAAPSAPGDPLQAAAARLRALLPERYGALTEAELAALTSLDLAGAKLTDADLAWIATLPALASLSLRGTPVTDAGLAALWSAPALKAVDLRGTQVSAAGVASLPLGRLEALHLTDTQVAGADLRRLPPMPNLRVFKLNGLAVGDDGLRDLPYLPGLEHLEVDRTSITEAGVRDLLRGVPTLKRIELRSTGVGPEALAQLRAEYPGVELVGEFEGPIALRHR